MVRIVFGMILALILAPLVLLAWLRLGHVPVAVADSPFPRRQDRRDAGKLIGLGQEFRSRLAGLAEPQEDLVAMRIKSRRGHAGVCGQHLQARDGEDGNPRGLGQTFHRSQPHAHTGKAAGAVHCHHCMELAEFD